MCHVVGIGRAGDKGVKGSMDTEQQLRSTSDQVLGALEKLHELEIEKRTVAPTNPRFHELAREVEQLADSLANKAEVQADLGETVAQQYEQTGETATPIAEMPRDAMAILNEWRDAERRASAMAPGSAEETAARADVDRLRGEYQR